MADVEQLFLSKVIRTQDIANAVQHIRVDFFHDPVHVEVWEFILEYWAEYNSCPSADRVRMEYPEWRMEKTPDVLESYSDLLFRNHKKHSAIEIAIDANEKLKLDDVDGALAVMSAGTIELAQSTTKTDDVDALSTWESRVSKWKHYAEDPGALVGIPTGFPFIDSLTGGMQPEQFCVLLGPPKAGKSTIALKVAISANNAGFSVVFLSYEMSNEEQEARYDGMRAGFNPNKLLQGKMSSREFSMLEKTLWGLKDNPPLWFVHDMGARSLSGMIAKAHQYKPDLLIIDGMYLMDPEMTRESYSGEGLTKISRSTKLLAQTLKIPVFGTTQASDAKWTQKQGLTQKAAMYTQGFGQDCDIMMGIEPTDEDNSSIVRAIMGRNFGKASAAITFDWEHGCIEEREKWDGESEEDDEDSSEDISTRRGA